MDDDLKARMGAALYRLFERLGADIDVLAAVGSFGDTLSDEDVVDCLEGCVDGAFVTFSVLQ